MASSPTSSRFSVKLMHKGKNAMMSNVTSETTVDQIAFCARSEFGLSETAMVKLLHKGKVLGSGDGSGTSDEGAPAFSKGVGVGKFKSTLKIIVMATEHEAVGDLNGRRSDPTVRGFDDEKAAPQQTSSPWGPAHVSQNKNFKFCRFEECSWRSFGHRADDQRTPHAFKARALLERLATDPGIVAIMVERELVVGTLGEMDPIDDRIAQQMEKEGGRVMGYNTNFGARIDLKLRQDDLTFLPYEQLAATLIHELSHNWVGDHDALFWINYGQMRVEYLYAHARVAAEGYYVDGSTTARLAGVPEYAAAVGRANHAVDATQSSILDAVHRGVVAELAKETAPHGVPLSAVAPGVSRRCREIADKDDWTEGSSSDRQPNGRRLGGEVGTKSTVNATGGGVATTKTDLRSLALAAAERRARKGENNDDNGTDEGGEKS